MPYSIICGYKDCFEKQRAGSSKSFFGLPKDNRNLVWLKHSGINYNNNIQSKENIKLCELHFYEKDVRQLSIKKILSSTAYPKPFGNVCDCNEHKMDYTCNQQLLSNFNTPANSLKTYQRTQKKIVSTNSNFIII